MVDAAGLRSLVIGEEMEVISGCDVFLSFLNLSLCFEEEVVVAGGSGPFEVEASDWSLLRKSPCSDFILNSVCFLLFGWYICILLYAK